MKPGFAFVFLVLTAGLTACVTTGPVLRTDLLVPTLEPPIVAAPPQAGITFAAVPAQLGSFDGVEKDKKGELLPVSVRVPQAGVPGTRQIIPPSEEPTLVGTDNYPRFNYRTLPLLPFGAFFLKIDNHSDHALTIDPTRVRLIAGGHEVKPFPDSGAQEGRYGRIVTEIGAQARHLGEPAPGIYVDNIRHALHRLDKAVTIEAGATYEGYALFDTNSLTADEYVSFLNQAGSVELQLTDGSQTLASVHFDIKTEKRPSVCLPQTTQPSFARCEVLAAPR